MYLKIRGLNLTTTFETLTTHHSCSDRCPDAPEATWEPKENILDQNLIKVRE